MRKKAIILLLVLALTLWALPTLALADGEPTSSGEVGTTEASINVDEETAEASASAASSEVPEPDQAVGAADASAPPADSEATAETSGIVDNGGGSTTAIGTIEVSGAEAGAEPPVAAANERVKNVTVTAPDGLPFDTLATIDKSVGEAVVGDGEGSGDCNTSCHLISYETSDDAYLFDTEGDNNDGIIKFKEGGAWAYSWVEGIGEPFAYSTIDGLSIWDPDTSGYVNFADFDSVTNPPDGADLAAINALLKKSNLFMADLVAADVVESDASAFAWARLMTVLYPASGDILLKLILADVSSQTNFALIDGDGGEEVHLLNTNRMMTDAWAKGKELYFEYTAPPKQEEQPKSTTPPTEPTVTPTAAPQPEIQPVQPQPEVQPVAPQPQAQPQAQPTPSRGAERELPVTGFNYLWLLLGVGLILTGLRLRRI